MIFIPENSGEIAETSVHRPSGLTFRQEYKACMLIFMLLSIPPLSKLMGLSLVSS